MSEVRASTLKQARGALLEWYDLNKRALPWRDRRDPWAIWLSEVMLQQTRVVSVLEYYPRFIERFPSPRDLAEASWEEVSALWAGLGYYRRARNLQAAAQQLCEAHDGVVPRDPARFAALKGVGRYTCGAVMSIAFDLEEPIVDGNVTRVFTRWYAEERDARAREVQQALWGWAERWVKGERPGDLNQAIMELGATICTPKSPRCEQCPLASSCQARARSLVSALPYLPKKVKTLPEEIYLAGISREGQGLWVVQAADEGLLGGLWGLPLTLWEGETAPLDEVLACAGEQLSLFAPAEPEELERGRALLQLQRKFESVGRLICSVSHRFTHKVWRLYVFEAHGAPELSVGERAVRLVSIEELSGMGLGGPSLKAGRAAGLALRARRGAGAR